MAIKIVEELNKKIEAKGELVSIDETGFTVRDLKEDVEEVLSFEEIKTLVGKNVKISITNKEEVE